MYNDFGDLRYILHLLEDSLGNLDEIEFPIDDKENNRRLRSIKRHVQRTVDELDLFVNEDFV